MYADDMTMSEALAWEAELDQQLAAAAGRTAPSEQAIDDLNDVRRRIVELQEQQASGGRDSTRPASSSAPRSSRMGCIRQR
jgi:hypothetical protein